MFTFNIILIIIIIFVYNILILLGDWYIYIFFDFIKNEGKMTARNSWSETDYIRVYWSIEADIEFWHTSPLSTLSKHFRDIPLCLTLLDEILQIFHTILLTF